MKRIINKNAFTFVELLVSLAVYSLIMLIIYTFFFNSNNIWNTKSDEIINEQYARNIMVIFNKSISEADFFKQEKDNKNEYINSVLIFKVESILKNSSKNIYANIKVKKYYYDQNKKRLEECYIEPTVAPVYSLEDDDAPGIPVCWLNNIVKVDFDKAKLKPDTAKNNALCEYMNKFEIKDNENYIDIFMELSVSKKVKSQNMQNRFYKKFINQNN